MAVDSLVTHGDVRAGTAKKWRQVPDFYGGGFVAACGDTAKAAEALDGMERKGDHGPDQSNDLSLLWLKANGEAWTLEAGRWFTLDAPFYAEGCGAQLALGAMAFGATAEEAARIACDMHTACGGEITVLSVGEP